MEERVKNHNYSWLERIENPCSESPNIQLKFILKGLKVKRTISRRYIRCKSSRNGRVIVLRCGLICCRSAFFHLAAVCFRASVVRLHFVLQHDSCSSFFVDDDWLYCPIDPAFMLPRESHARVGFNTNLIGVRLQSSSTTNLIGQLF